MPTTPATEATRAVRHCPMAAPAESAALAALAALEALMAVPCICDQSSSSATGTITQEIHRRTRLVPTWSSEVTTE